MKRSNNYYSKEKMEQGSDFSINNNILNSMNSGNTNFISGINNNNKPFIKFDNYDKNGIEAGMESPQFFYKKNNIFNLKNKENSISNSNRKNISTNNDFNKFSFGNIINNINPSKNTYAKIHKNSISNISNRNNSKIEDRKNTHTKKGRIYLFFKYKF